FRRAIPAARPVSEPPEPRRRVDARCARRGRQRRRLLARPAVAQRNSMNTDISGEAAADAPGRVNLIGEHTDYHDGFVLPAVIPQRTWVRLRRRADRRVRARSASVPGTWAEYELGNEATGRGWLDYVQGVTAAAAAAGMRLDGFDAEITST